MSALKLPCVGGPMRVGLLPITQPHEGGWGQRRKSSLLKYFFRFCHYQMNMLT